MTALLRRASKLSSDRAFYMIPDQEMLTCTVSARRHTSMHFTVGGATYKVFRHYLRPQKPSAYRMDIGTCQQAQSSHHNSLQQVCIVGLRHSDQTTRPEIDATSGTGVKAAESRALDDDRRGSPTASKAAFPHGRQPHRQVQHHYCVPCTNPTLLRAHTACSRCNTGHDLKRVALSIFCTIVHSPQPM